MPNGAAAGMLRAMEQSGQFAVGDKSGLVQWLAGGIMVS
jgi:hypothetical protein